MDGIAAFTIEEKNCIFPLLNISVEPSVGVSTGKICCCSANSIMDATKVVPKTNKSETIIVASTVLQLIYCITAEDIREIT
jgi:hypothetical protein